MEFKERTDKWYDEMYAGAYDYLKHYTESRYYFLWSVIADRMAFWKLAKFLDIGCGTGQFASLLFDRGFKNYLGVDFSRIAIATARSCCSKLDFIISDILQPGILETEDYDCVTALEFLEHIEDDLGVISRIKPDTSFWGTVPSFRCDSHVRAFANAGQVERRYGKFFNEFSADTFLMAPKKHKFYLIEGVRNEQTSK